MSNFDPDGILYVLGAGAEVSMGLPVMLGLAKKLNGFSKAAGKPINDALRGRAKNLRINLDRIGADTADQIAEIVLGRDAGIVAGIKNSLKSTEGQSAPGVSAMLNVLGKLEEIRDANRLDEPTATALADFAGESPEAASETLFNPRKMSLDGTARQALLRACQEALNDASTLNAAQREVVEALFDALATFEDLLGALFVGFFNGDKNLQKKYFYLAWLFWSYIRVLEGQGQRYFEESCYALLRDLGARRAITFNYTGFLDQVQNCEGIYFHGRGAQLMNFETRQIIEASSVIRGTQPIAPIAHYLGELAEVNWDTRISAVVLPAIVPPLIMKPLIASEFVDVWHEASDAISKATCIVSIGYSFSVADEHFNDLIRKRAATTPIVIFDPKHGDVANNFCRISGRKAETLVPGYHSGLNCLLGRGFISAEAKAEEVSDINVRELVAIASAE